MSPGARIFRSYDQDDWILVGDGLTPAAFYWAALGADGVDDMLGIALIGKGDEIEVAGNIYIDCHKGVLVSTLTAAQIAQIVTELESDVAPAYMRIILGYINATGAFIEYANGRIE